MKKPAFAGSFSLRFPAAVSYAPVSLLVVPLSFRVLIRVLLGGNHSLTIQVYNLGIGTQEIIPDSEKNSRIVVATTGPMLLPRRGGL